MGNKPRSLLSPAGQEGDEEPHDGANFEEIDVAIGATLQHSGTLPLAVRDQLLNVGHYNRQSEISRRLPSPKIGSLMGGQCGLKIISLYCPSLKSADLPALVNSRVRRSGCARSRGKKGDWNWPRLQQPWR